MGGEAEARSNLDLPGKQQELIDAVKATGKPFAVVLFNCAPADAVEGRRRLARDPRGLVRRRRGRQRRRRRALRQGQPGRQAAGLLPAQRRPDPDLLQPRADRPPVRRDARSTTRATATSPSARRCTSSATASATRRSRSTTCGCRSRLDDLARVDHRDRRRDQHRHGRRRRRRAALHPRPGRVHLAAGPPPARLRARDARRRARRRRSAGSSTRATSASTTTRASSASSPARSRSTRATARARALKQTSPCAEFPQARRSQSVDRSARGGGPQ